MEFRQRPASYIGQVIPSLESDTYLVLDKLDKEAIVATTNSVSDFSWTWLNWLNALYTRD
jgi:hypothetical protein